MHRSMIKSKKNMESSEDDFKEIRIFISDVYKSSAMYMQSRLVNKWTGGWQVLLAGVN